MRNSQGIRETGLWSGRAHTNTRARKRSWRAASAVSASAGGKHYRTAVQINGWMERADLLS